MMATDSHGSVSLWLDRLKQGDEGAAQRLWDRYFHRLVALAQIRLQGVTQGGDGEDVALSALNSVFIGVRDGSYPKLRDRTELWPLLVAITIHKASNARKWQNAQKRTPQAVDHAISLEHLISAEPSPDLVVEIGDELNRLISGLKDDVLSRIALLRLEGYLVSEIAEKVGLGQRTVARKLARIRQEWDKRAS
jgi:DNA-directed RNA polymerase specialized sigma24 family protein